MLEKNKKESSGYTLQSWEHKTFFSQENKKKKKKEDKTWKRNEKKSNLFYFLAFVSKWPFIFQIGLPFDNGKSLIIVAICRGTVLF